MEKEEPHKCFRGHGALAMMTEAAEKDPDSRVNRLLDSRVAKGALAKPFRWFAKDLQQFRLQMDFFRAGILPLHG